MRKKLCIILDSFSSYSENEIEKLGFWFLPQKLLIDGKNYEDGRDIHLEDKETQEKILNLKDFKTSLPPIGEMEDIFAKASKEYDNVIFIPMNKGISSTFAVAKTASNQFGNVYVIDNKLAGSAIIEVSKKAMIMAQEEKNIEQIIKFIEETSKNSYCIVIPHTLESLIRSGRLQGIKKFILEKSKLIPSLLLGENGFEVKGLKRNFSKSITNAIETIQDKLGIDKFKKATWEIIYTSKQETLEIAQKCMNSKLIENFKIRLSTVGVAVHSGIGAIGINSWVIE